MYSLFGLLLVFHILGAIAVIGPAFMVPVIRGAAGSVSQLRFAFVITSRLAVLPKIGGAVLIVTGAGLMIITKIGLSQMWLNLSLLLSLLLIVVIDVLIEPRTKKLMKLAVENQGQDDDIPRPFLLAMKKLASFELAAQLLVITITALMAMKPF